MIQKIWKITVTDRPIKYSLSMPVGAKVLSVGNQEGILVIWIAFNVDNELEKEERDFQNIWTGREFEVPGPEFVFIGRVEIGGLVVHVIEHPKQFGF